MIIMEEICISGNAKNVENILVLSQVEDLHQLDVELVEIMYGWGVPAGRSSSSDWQCIHCGKHPSSWETNGEGSRPSDSSTCPSTGFKHVWDQL